MGGAASSRQHASSRSAPEALARLLATANGEDHLYSIPVAAGRRSFQPPLTHSSMGLTCHTCERFFSGRNFSPASIPECPACSSFFIEYQHLLRNGRSMNRHSMLSASRSGLDQMALNDDDMHLNMTYFAPEENAEDEMAAENRRAVLSYLAALVVPPDEEFSGDEKMPRCETGQHANDEFELGKRPQAQNGDETAVVCDRKSLPEGLRSDTRSQAGTVLSRAEASAISTFDKSKAEPKIDTSFDCQEHAQENSTAPSTPLRRKTIDPTHLMAAIGAMEEHACPVCSETMRPSRPRCKDSQWRVCRVPSSTASTQPLDDLSGGSNSPETSFDTSSSSASPAADSAVEAHYNKKSWSAELAALQQQEREKWPGVVTLPACKHSFHGPCILRWAEERANCPVCRTPIVCPDITAPGDGPPSDYATIPTADATLVMAAM